MSAESRGVPQNSMRKYLKSRIEKHRYFDLASMIGPRVFIDTIPIVFNSIVVAVLGSIALFERKGRLCSTALRVYVSGQIVSAYILLIIIGWFTLRHQVSTHIRWPYILIICWAISQAAWTFVGVGAVTSDSKCYDIAPFFYGFALGELVLIAFLAAILLIKWFSSDISRMIRSRIVRKKDAIA